MMRCLHLLSSCRTASTSHPLEVPPAFKTPPPLVRWCLRLVVTMPLAVPLLLLVLLTIQQLLSANASPPIDLLFASRLLHHPCSCAAAASHPLVMPPPPRNNPPPPVSCLLVPLLFFASPLLAGCHITSCPAATSSVYPQPPTFVCTGWLLRCILSCCFHLPSSRQHHRLLMSW